MNGDLCGALEAHEIVLAEGRAHGKRSGRPLTARAPRRQILDVLHIGGLD
jgi:hypothetical protein